MSLLRTEISQTMNLAENASLAGGKVDNVAFLGGKGNDTFVVNGNNNMVLTETGDDNVVISGDFNLVMDEAGSNAIYSTGNNNTFAAKNGNNVIYSEGDRNEILTEKGNQYIESHGNDNLIDAGNGSHHILFTGDGNDVDFGNGNSTVYFFGTDNVVNGGNGDHTIMTLDYLIEQGQYTEYADLVESYAEISETKTLVQSIDVDEQITNVATGNEGVGTAGFVDESNSSSTQDVSVSKKSEYTSKQYTKDGLLNMLSSSEKAAAEKLDLTEQYNGKNRYVFAKGADGKVHVYDKKGSSNETSYKCIVSVAQGSNFLHMRGASPATTADGIAVCFKNEELKETTTTTTTTTTTVNTKASSGNYNDLVNYGETIMAKQTTKGTIDTYQYDTQYDFGKVQNVINLGNGTHNVSYTGSGAIFAGCQTQNANSASNYVQRGGIQTTSYQTFDNTKKDVLYFVDNTKQLVQSVDDVKENISSTLFSQVSTGSPLIVDFNKDGKVSAEAGKGVDIDNNGKADGAATGGDKMLAMSDMNKNGKIDGSEVFGDQTVNPFTGQKINAANGFEALKEVAKSAYEKTGINCLNNGNVDLQALKVALALVGVNLGFISDDNTSNLEDLAHVKSINVENYAQQNQTGSVQHNQLGSYTSADGKTYKTDDVWFELS